MKILINTESQLTLLLFLVLALGDCLHWYALPREAALHRGLYVTLIILSLLNCLLLLRRLNATRQLLAKTRLKLISAPPEIETKFEMFVRWALASLLAALCGYVCAALWGGLYLSGKPTVGSGYAALLVLTACEVIGIIAAFRLSRIKRSMKSGEAKTRPGQPAA